MRRFASFIVMSVFAGALVLAQTPRPAQPTPPAQPAMPPAPPPAPAPHPPLAPQPARAPATPAGPSAPAPAERPQAMPSSSYQNVKMDVTFTDSQAGEGAPAKRTVTVMALDARSGRVRSNSPGGTINVDAGPTIRPDGRIMVNLTLVYTSMTPSASLDESLTVILSDGKPLLVTQSANPQSDRKVTVEVTATVLK